MGYAVANGLDDASALVTEDHRPATFPERALHQPDVRVAYARGGEPNQHLAGLREVELDVLNPDEPWFVENRSLNAH